MNWISNLNLKAKFSTIIAAPIFAFVIIFLVVLNNGRNIETNIEELTTIQAQTIAEINNLLVQGFQSGQATRNIMLNVNDKTAAKNYNKAKNEFYKSIEKINELQKNNSKLIAVIERIRTLSISVFEKSEKAQNLAISGETEEATSYLNNFTTPEWRLLKEELFSAANNQSSTFDNFRIKTKNEMNFIIKMIEIIGFLAIISSMVLGYLGVKSILKPILALKNAALKIASGNTHFTLKVIGKDEIGELRVAFNQMIENINKINNNLVAEKESVEKRVEEATTDAVKKQKYLEEKTAIVLNAMDKFAKGDLTQKLHVDSTDEMGKLFNGFNIAIENIGKLMLKVSESIHATASASAEISSSAEQMAAGAEEQSSQTSEVSVAIDEMTRTIYDGAKNTSIAAENAKNSGIIAKKGGMVVNKTIDEMNKISEIVAKASETVQVLGNNSEKIGEIISVISDIADQTNLLALNAAIEAARAGEQGRGFAVVADEVRKLAERTTTATKEISGMIKQIQIDTNEAVTSMTKGTTKVEQGTLHAVEAGKVLEEIVKSSEKVTDVMVQVAATSEEQSSTAEEITKRIEGINNVTHENTIGIQQIAKASEDLSQLTTNLQDLISSFKVSQNLVATHSH